MRTWPFCLYKVDKITKIALIFMVGRLFLYTDLAQGNDALRPPMIFSNGIAVEKEELERVLKNRINDIIELKRAIEEIQKFITSLDANEKRIINSKQPIVALGAAFKVKEILQRMMLENPENGIILIWSSSFALCFHLAAIVRTNSMDHNEYVNPDELELTEKSLYKVKLWITSIEKANGKFRIRLNELRHTGSNI